MDSRQQPVVKVVYIMGWGRSGSTLLDNVLGQVEGFLSVGELHYLWERGISGEGRCGCSLRLSRCQVWTRSLNELARRLGGPIDAAELADLQERTVRNRHTPRLLGWVPSDARLAGETRRYGELLGHLYGSLAATSGADVVVDSSKRIPRAALLQQVEGIDPYFIHLVRDPRAVAYSWTRSKPLTQDGEGRMRRFKPFASTLRWVLWTAGGAAVRRRMAERSLLVSYESFVERPRDVVCKILQLIGEGNRALPFVSSHEVHLKPTHTVSGNPTRFEAGTVTIRRDDRWKSDQSRRDKVVATGVALPLLRSYGYPLWPRT